MGDRRRWRAGRSTLFYNPLAAVPSLHVGFAFAIGYAIARLIPRRPGSAPLPGRAAA